MRVVATSAAPDQDRPAARSSLAKGGIGAFTETLRPHRGHRPGQGDAYRTAQMLGFLAARALTVLDPQAGFGASGPFVALIQQRLSALHVYVPAERRLRHHTGLALDAYHRLLGWGVSQSLDAATVSELLDGVGSFHVRFPGTARTSRATSAASCWPRSTARRCTGSTRSARASRPRRPSSATSASTSVPGYLPDGMYFSSFFFGGYAIHGYNPAPDYPASHGCMRLPIIDAISVYDWLNFGDWVDVYYE